MATLATRRVPKELYSYGKENRSVINEDSFKQLAEFGYILLATKIDKNLLKTINSKMVTLALPFYTELSGLEISCGLYLHKLINESESEDDVVDELMMIKSETTKRVSTIYRELLSNDSKRRTYTKKVSDKKRKPKAKVEYPSRQVMTLYKAAELGKVELLKLPITERADKVEEMVAEFDKRQITNDQIESFGVLSEKRLVQLCMGKREMSTKDFEKALIMTCIMKEENYNEKRHNDFNQEESLH